MAQKNTGSDCLELNRKHSFGMMALIPSTQTGRTGNLTIRKATNTVLLLQVAVNAGEILDVMGKKLTYANIQMFKKLTKSYNLKLCHLMLINKRNSKVLPKNAKEKLSVKLK